MNLKNNDTMKNLFLLVILLSLLCPSIFAGDAVNENQKNSKKILSTGINIGILDCYESGYLNDRMSFSTISHSGLFISVKKIYFDLILYNDIVNVTNNFIEESGYQKQHFNLKYSNLMISIGYDLIGLSNICFTPYLGLRNTEIKEYDNLYDHHPNWDLSARSNSSPLCGLRIKYNVIILGDCGYDLSFLNNINFNIFFDFRVSWLNFNNSEFGKGNTFEFSIGFMPEYIMYEK